MDVPTRLAALSTRYELPEGTAVRLLRLMELVAAEPMALTAVRDLAAATDVHIADSLTGLALPEVRAAGRIADLGAGGGYPGLVLAIALPKATVSLVESVAKKADFLRRAATSLELTNVDVVPARAEDWVAGIGGQDLVTARALGQLPLLLEYAAPLLRVGGALVAWKGSPDRQEIADGQAAAQELGMSDPVSHPAAPSAVPGADARTLYVSLKVGPTPARYPRRAGMARKRPLGSSTRP